MSMKEQQTKPDGGASVSTAGLERRPLPGGIALTVTERCELYDWKDACVEAAVVRAIAVEREACAMVCGSLVHAIDGGGNKYRRPADAEQCAAKIRMRSNAKVTGAAPEKG